MTTSYETAIEAAARACHEANRAYCIALGDVNGDSPKESHASWLAEKERAGWKYGAVKDPEKKEHPCFVPYADLPDEQRRKDGIFVAVAREVCASLGWAAPKGDA